MAGDTVLGHVAAFVRRMLRFVPLARQYPGTIKGQNAASGAVEFLPDDSSELGDKGASGLALALGLPGFRVKVPSGARARLWFDAFDPSRPRVGSFDAGSSVTEVAFDGGTRAVSRVQDTTASGELRTVLATVSGVPVVVALYWRGPGGGAWSLVASGATPPTPADSGTPVTGVITSGNTKLLA